MSNYGATKAFNDAFSKAIELEYSTQIDIISLRPLFVESNLSKNQKSAIMATRNQCASATIKYLGLDYETNGYWMHRLVSYLINSLPTPLIRGMSEG